MIDFAIPTEIEELRGRVILEESGYGLLGPPAMNCAAPDEGKEEG
jgi:hypothetical protein